MVATTSSLNHDGLMLLEAPFARVPHDELRSYLRTQQRFFERDLTFCSTTLESVAKSSRSARTSLSNIAHAGSSSSRGHAQPTTAGEGSGVTRQADAEQEQADMSVIDASLLSDVTFTASEPAGDDSFLGDLSSASVTASPQRASAAAAAPAASPSTSKAGGELDRSLDLMIGRIKGLKRKLTQVHEATGATLTRLEARTAHLDQIHQIHTPASPAFDEWCRTRLDRMLVDWMLRKGFSRSAELLAKNRRIEKFVDLSLFAEIARIEVSLVGGSAAAPFENGADEHGARTQGDQARTCGPSLAWCSENKAALRKIRSTLEFDLRLQEFIELTRDRTPKSLHEAIVYSRRYLLPYLSSSSPAQSSKGTATANQSEGTSATASKAKADEKEEREEREQQDAIRKQVARVMGLLACGPGGWAYGDLYSDTRWQMLRTKFRDAALQIHSLPPQPLLHIALSAGLSSLKLPACYADEQTHRTTIATPAHLGGRAFGDERSNLLSMAGITTTSVSAPPIFPPAAGVPTGGFSDPPTVVLSPPVVSANSTGPFGVSKGGDSGGPVASHCRNANCPVCDLDGLGVLAKEVPWSHHANSTLVCAISGRIMNENDSPMALPNGRVYSSTALQEMAANSADGSTIVCPRTGAEYQVSQLRKIYIS